MDENNAEQEQARAFFPRGLLQPHGSFRFSADALLLAAFLSPVLAPVVQGADQNAARLLNIATPPKARPAQLLDIGTGCGVVALSMLRRFPTLTATGVDTQLPLVLAAKENAARLGFAGRFTALHVDVALRGGPSESSPAPAPCSAIPAGVFDLALANPPYRKKGQGRLPGGVAGGMARSTALVEEETTLDAFCRAAARGLRNKGRFGLIFPAARLTELVAALERNGFGLRRLLPIHSRAEEAATLILVEARKATRSDLVLEPPLILYGGHGEATRLTGAALTFCPELGTNAGRAPND